MTWKEVQYRRLEFWFNVAAVAVGAALLALLALVG